MTFTVCTTISVRILGTGRATVTLTLVARIGCKRRRRPRRATGEASVHRSAVMAVVRARPAVGVSYW
ncbi:hypothetical protein N7U49_48035 (plasmid) [Streptomyces sp. AD2-2]|nr:hypothetical protein N7U49_48035 [Streptomyces sp. AD2-2]